MNKNISHTLKLMIFALIGLVLAGCSTDSKNETTDLDKLAASITDNIEFSDELIEIKFPVVGDFYNLTENSLKNYKVYKSASGATAEEFALFETAGSSTDDIHKAISQRVDDLKFEFESYVPEEMQKLSDAVIFTKGNYVFLGISNDSGKIKDIFEQAFK